MGPDEQEFCLQRFGQMSLAFPAALGHAPGLTTEQEQHVPALLHSLSLLRQDRDLEAFRGTVDKLSRVPGFSTVFPGFNFGVAMFMNSVVKQTPDPSSSAAAIVSATAVPSDWGQARQQLTSLLDHVASIQSGPQPALKSAVICAAFFWWLQAPDAWRPLLPAAEDAMKKLGWLRSDLSPVEHYERYDQLIVGLRRPVEEVESVLAAFSAQPWTGLDVALPERLDWARLLYDNRIDGNYPDGQGELAKANVAAVLAEMRLLGDHVEEQVGAALGRPVRRHVANEFWDRAAGAYRANTWVQFRPRELEGWVAAPSLTVLMSSTDVVVGLAPGRRERGWAASVQPELADLAPQGLEVISTSVASAGQPASTDAGDYVVGLRLDPDEVVGRADFAEQVVELAAALRPLMDKVLQLAQGAEGESGMFDGPQDQELAPLFARWKSESGYPTEHDEQHRARRAEFAALLQRDALPELDLADFRRIYNGQHYGAPGPQANLNRTLKDADDATMLQLLDVLEYLLWGPDHFATRINRSLDQDDLGLKGLGESVVMKLLAVCHPDRFVPLFPLSGDNGKLAILASLGEAPPSNDLGRGERQVAANDQIRRRLEPFLPGDPWGQMVFSYWLRNQQLDPMHDLEQTRLDTVVDECFLPDRSFVDELVELLEDKRQIVLYGPPGTGKTFIARKLAAALAPGDAQRKFVQFHPSTSYEDFFEGYRPSTDASGNLSYSLEPGPFAQLADRASTDPKRHVLVIDELNRANIPKVFGELLFLLEYRDQEVVPLYRPDGFLLPDNLWVIATMNTADRSIASLDAALRRRFHFIPIFPDEGPMGGLLDRYLDRLGGDRAWARLVDMVNAELRDRLGNGDLLIGPSHFMKSDLDEARMARIWRYNVEPFVDDLFYGDPQAIAEFHWPAVLKRFRAFEAPDLGGEASAPEGPVPETDDV